MNDMLRDIDRSRKETVKPVDERDILNNKDKPEIGELFKTYLNAEGRLTDPRLQSALAKPADKRSRLENALVGDVVEEFNQRLKSAEKFLDYLKTTGMEASAASALPIDPGHFETFVRGMAVRNPNSLTTLTQNITTLQRAAQNRDSLVKYSKTRKELITLAAKFGLQEKQVLGIAKLPDEAQRRAAVDALLSGTKNERLILAGWATRSTEASADVAKLLEQFVASQSNARSALQGLENSFLSAKSEDEDFVDQVEKLAIRTPGKHASLEDAHRLASGDYLAERFKETLLAQPNGKALVQSMEMNLARNPSMDTDDFFTKHGIGTFGTSGFVSYGDIFENIAKNVEQDLTQRGFISSLLEILFSPLFKRMVRSDETKERVLSALRK